MKNKLKTAGYYRKNTTIFLGRWTGCNVENHWESPERIIWNQSDTERKRMKSSKIQNWQESRYVVFPVCFCIIYTFICLDIFKTAIHNKNRKITNRLEEWLIFLNEIHTFVWSFKQEHKWKESIIWDLSEQD